MESFRLRDISSLSQFSENYPNWVSSFPYGSTLLLILSESQQVGYLQRGMKKLLLPMLIVILLYHGRKEPIGV